MKILARDIPPRTAWALEQAGVHPLLARLFAARGVQSRDDLDDGGAWWTSDVSALKRARDGLLVGTRDGSTVGLVPAS